MNSLVANKSEISLKGNSQEKMAHNGWENKHELYIRRKNNSKWSDINNTVYVSYLHYEIIKGSPTL